MHNGTCAYICSDLGAVDTLSRGTVEQRCNDHQPSALSQKRSNHVGIPGSSTQELNYHFDTSEISTVVNGDVCKLYTLSDMSILEAAHAHTRLMRARQADLTVAHHINL